MEAVQQAADWRERFVMAMALVGAVAVVCVITFFLTGASWAVLVGVSLINPAS
jgi:hypothetical protein